MTSSSSSKIPSSSSPSPTKKADISTKKGTSGKVAAAFLAVCISVIILGILSYFRTQLPWLEIYKPIAVYGGILVYSYVICGVLWAGLYLVLRQKENIGNLKVWITIFIISIIASTILIEASLKWTRLW
ncbi:MAG TPA: hypothetical protein VHF08_03450 [Nitrososphaeraceae archaeon]|nr:hypothetical protein [Nitrososphaeraceae archaeon]